MPPPPPRPQTGSQQRPGAKPAAAPAKPGTAAIKAGAPAGRPGQPGTARQVKPAPPPPPVEIDDEEDQPAPAPRGNYRKEAQEAGGAAKLAVPSLIGNGVLALMLIAFIVMWWGANGERKVAVVEAARAADESKKLDSGFKQAQYRVYMAKLEAAKLLVASVYDGMDAAKVAGQMRSQGGAAVGFARDLLESLDPVVRLQIRYLEKANELVIEARKGIAETMPGHQLDGTAAKLSGITEEMRKQLATSIKGLDEKQSESFSKAKDEMRPRLKEVVDDLAMFGKF